jgi:hypothetical protein
VSDESVKSFHISGKSEEATEERLLDPPESANRLSRSIKAAGV